MRVALIVLPVLVLAGCATDNPGQGNNGNIEILAASSGQALTGAQCTVSTAAGRWDVTPPAVVPVGANAGDLRVACSKPGYRNSEVMIRPSPYASGGYGYPNVGVGVGGGSGNVGVGFGFNFPISGGGGAPQGGYPPRIVVEMTPQ